LLIGIGAHHPRVDPTAWVAPDADLIGDVTLGESASVWYTAVVRADTERISIGAGSNVQDGAVLHADPGFPLVIGAGVTVGHGAKLHGCRVDDDVLVGVGAIMLNGSSVGRRSIVGAGALVPERITIPPGSLVLGVPGRVRRATTPAEWERITVNARVYVEHVRLHRGATRVRSE
jgi:carbonic anhydrase/acetyltransferase-like protein (isoleucine patch superfamily)